MTFLPIVDRELRVAARKARTYWSRVATALAAMFIAAALVIIAELEKGTLRTQIGPILFGIFKFLSFAFACSAGVFLTSDCVSEEKRDGTLGLLFLTDLRGYDVVSGKLLASSLQAAYGLLAAFPIIGLSFLLGGVTGGEFWRLVLLLFNTLFFSLALGVLISSVSRDAQKAMNGTLLGAAVFILVFPGIDWWMAGWKPMAFAPRLSLFSPTFAFMEAGAARLANFWLCMALIHALAWLFLIAASASAPRTWKEKSAGSLSLTPSLAQRFRFGSTAKRTALRRYLLGINPIAWLAIRDRWLVKTLWLFLLAGLGLFVLLVWTTHASSNAAGGLQRPTMMFYPLVDLVGMMFKLWVAAHACRFLVEARRTGALELVLVTPVQPETVVRGHWWGMRHIFLLPVIAILIAQAIVDVMVMVATVEQIRASMAASGNTGVWNSSEFLIQQGMSKAFALLSFLTSLLALAWFGMWMGLTTRKVNVAVIKTLVFVEVLPWLVFTFTFMIFQIGLMSGRPGYLPSWLPQLLAGCVSLAADIAFILVSRRKVLRGFRGFVTETSDRAPIRHLPPLLPESAIAAPPVIAS